MFQGSACFVWVAEFLSINISACCICFFLTDQLVTISRQKKKKRVFVKFRKSRSHINIGYLPTHESQSTEVVSKQFPQRSICFVP